jgi:hypothetical protein
MFLVGYLARERAPSALTSLAPRKCFELLLTDYCSIRSISFTVQVHTCCGSIFSQIVVVWNDVSNATARLEWGLVALIMFLSSPPHLPLRPTTSMTQDTTVRLKEVENMTDPEPEQHSSVGKTTVVRPPSISHHPDIEVDSNYIVRNSPPAAL